MHTADRGAHRAPARRDLLAAVALYTVLTIVLTWPLARGLDRDVAGDFGDPLFESWVMAWDATHLGPGLWTANIFFPHQLTLAYSESLLPQAIEALPAYWLTRNPLLGYNLVFLSTFVLSGVGMFLLVRALTGSRAAACVGGLAYAFAPYRFGTLPHMQVLSSQWMPFVLYGFRQYFVTRRTRHLVGTAAAWTVQNLSCLYYLLYFAPVAAVYVGWEISVRRLWRDRRTLLAIAATGISTVVVTAPFLLPYLEVRRLGMITRSLTETEHFSADTYAYLTASPFLRLLGGALQAWPKPEALLFPGVTIVALAILGVIAAPVSDTDAPRRARVSDTFISTLKSQWMSVAILRGLKIVMLAAAVLLVALIFGYRVHLPGLRVTSVGRVITVGAVAATAVLVLSPRDRLNTARWMTTPAAVFAIVTVFAIVMSFGPHLYAQGRLVADPSPYAFFFDYVPGFDGVRVPARFGMIVALGLAALAGFGVQAAERRGGASVAAIAAVLILVESFAVPIPIDSTIGGYEQEGLAPLPPTLALDANERAAYAYVARLPPGTGIVELPLGEPAIDIRYMFNSIGRWTPMVNGYSGIEPDAYAFLRQRLVDVDSRPDRAWDALFESRATYAIVHEALYDGDRGFRVSAWLRSHAVEAARFGSNRVFRLR